MEQETREHTLPMVAVLGIATIPLLFTLPAWISVWCFLLWGYAIAAHLKSWPWPNRPIRLGLTVVGCLMAVAFLEQGRFGNSTFVGLLAIMTGLKPLENRGHRDRMMTLFLVYFTIISGLFIIENLLITLYMFVSVFIATACLVHFNHPDRRWRDGLRLAGLIMLQAIPIMVLLFIFFPRMEGSFLTLQARRQGRTGFSDTLRPGEISRLVRDNKTAFRVEFQGALPSAEELYWRGVVLWTFDGSVWERGIQGGRSRKHYRGQRRFEYDITLEAHQKKYLFALDLPASSPPFTQLMEDHALIRRWPVSKGFRYHVTSYADVIAEASILSNMRALQLPAFGNSKSRELAETWKRQFRDSEAIVNKAIAYLKTNDFKYTLTPPLLEQDPVDSFLFEARKGYCEHYASAFAFLMRAAGVPARVVVGYLGGERNPYGNYLIVRQYHAHAWNEVFLEGRGWVRVDPTSAVVPERVSGGLAESLIPEELPDFLSRTKLAGVALYWNKARFMWDSVNLRWNAWFMDYSRYEQRDLWTSVWRQVRFNQKQLFGAAAMMMLLAGALVLYRIRRVRPGLAEDPVAAAYAVFCRKLERIGIRREAFQGPRDFALKASLLRTDLKQPVHEIIQRYIHLRYAGNGDEKAAKAFMKQVRKFHPPKAHKTRDF